IRIQQQREGIMRLRFSFLVFAVLCPAVVATAQSPAPTCADLHIVPAVRECSDVQAIPIRSAGLAVFTDKSGEDEFAAEDLRKTTIGRAMVGKPAPSIRLERLTNSPLAKELLSRHHVIFNPAMHEEGYVIVPE